ncbi:flagellar basal-body MS-ring/collar protein FliF [Asticcacaulis sp. YBE204]|uniref:flagellar basal-body MS-ring/collar protein FliF n=1 Tax=Asticcacaulis sp. YBE204 TaxID=1282363 RepID=UPI0003C3EB3F|nr:flagellar basal-body MS-ring/collar protein FliF [Asticcacaulis sp. YBE204]ESQ81367.1 flagellar M-ring protein FliF [Asticcacaulis sp. YBE204]
MEFLKQFGITRLAVIIGVSIGVAAVLAAIFLNMGGKPQALLYSNLDLKEASEITAALDQAGVKYEAKGDGSTIMVDRDHVGETRLMLASKGLPTAGSVGYELFDNAPALGQTEFVQNLNNQRALEGELARTISSLKGINSARVHLVMPKRELFQEEAAAPTASVVVGLSNGDLSGDQVRAIRNLVAGAVPNLKANAVTLVDDKNRLLAAGGEDDALLGAGGAERKSEIEESLRKRVKDIVEGVVGPGAARVTVTAELDLNSITREQTQYDPDGQVVRSTRTNSSADRANEATPDGTVTAAANIPGGNPNAGAGATGTQSETTDELTNYEISNTKTTEVVAPGAIKKLAVAVVVDGVSTPSADGKSPPAYAPRSAEDMQRLDQLVRAAIGFQQDRDTVEVLNVRFNRDANAVGGTEAKAGMFDFTKDDIMSAVQWLILAIVAILVLFFVARPLMKFVNGPGAGGGVAGLSGPGAMGALPAGMSAGALGYNGEPGTDLAVSAIDPRIDIAKIEGQVKASSVKRVSEFVDRHPDESISILRAWLHDN